MKRSQLNVLFLVLISLCLACESGNYMETENGVIVSLSSPDASDPNLVKIEVINGYIFRVSATPESDFPHRKSLIIVPQGKEETPFTVTEANGSVVISTEKSQRTANAAAMAASRPPMPPSTVLPGDIFG